MNNFTQSELLVLRDSLAFFIQKRKEESRETGLACDDAASYRCAGRLYQEVWGEIEKRND